MDRRTALGRTALGFAALLAIAGPAHAQTVTVDARDAAPAPLTGHLKLGTATAPDGSVLGVNNRHLTLNGKPWLPVMGEIHYVRLPRDEWDGALARIKASGVDIVATYVMWNYHEETAGNFNWSGDRDLHAFVDRAAAHGLKVMIRIGPWVHAEVRYGGIPDWVVQALPLRSSDPAYMHYVGRYWGEIAKQVQGQLWKDGGPIVGIQIENEYNIQGPLRGREHIADLRKLALAKGMDVPFYTVTGWDQTVYPKGEVLPVFGGYPDEPWASKQAILPPKETYAFRFDSRVSGNLGAQTKGRGGDADPDMPNTPFLGAEYGGGVPTMYVRRPVLKPEDIAAMLPVQLGSGVNLYGYYMYHGGRNQLGRTTLEENTSIGGYNDVPLIDYDFQAPYGGYGQANPVGAYVRPFHYFLRSYGAALAPMTVRKPAVTPAANDDLKTLRWSVRAAGDSAFVFASNHVRQYPMAEQSGVRFTVKLPKGDVTFPSKPVTIRDGAYFIWPVNLDLGGQILRWASAQPVTRIDDATGPVHVFEATDGIAPEFAFAPGSRISGAVVKQTPQGPVATASKQGPGQTLTVTRPGTRPVRILVLTQAQARKLWTVDLATGTHLILSDDDLADQGGKTLAFRSLGDAQFDFSAWPALPAGRKASLTLTEAGRSGIFTNYRAAAPAKTITAELSRIRAPGTAPKILVGGPANRALQPFPETFANSAGTWSLKLPADALNGLDDAYLDIDWAGDIGRLYAGDALIDDHYYDGRSWRIGLKRHAASLSAPLILRVSPLRADAPVHLDPALRPKLAEGAQIAEIRKVTVEPQYRLTIDFAQ